MVDPDISALPPDRRGSLSTLLTTIHRQSAAAPIEAAREDGALPSAFRRAPHTLVADTRCLGQDIGYACRNDQRTTLITSANRQALRVLCSQHVLDEVLRRRPIWSTDAAGPAYVPDEVFVARLRDEYVPLLRVVPDDGVPLSWLSPDERARIAILARKHTDDIPSVKLAVVTRSLYWSKDADALRAVYGADSDLVEQAEWLDRLKAGGDAAECLSLLEGVSTWGYLGSAGVVAGARRVYGAVGLGSVPIGAVAVYGVWRWLRDPSRAPFRAGLMQFVEFLGEIAEHKHERESEFDAALPVVPTWDELQSTNSHDDVVGRACLCSLAREPRGHLSAQELAPIIRRNVPCSDAKVRAILRNAPCFQEVYRGRWQVGTAATLRLDVA